MQIPLPPAQTPKLQAFLGFPSCSEWSHVHCRDLEEEVVPPQGGREAEEVGWDLERLWGQTGHFIMTWQDGLQDRRGKNR